MYKRQVIDKICSEAVALNNYIKCYLAVRVSFKKLINTENIYCNPVFRSRTELKSQYEDIDEQYSIASEKIMESVDKFTRDGSGWVENGVESVELNLSLIHI